jgi:hypothetical protein
MSESTDEAAAPRDRWIPIDQWLHDNRLDSDSLALASARARIEEERDLRSMIEALPRARLSPT